MKKITLIPLLLFLLQGLSARADVKLEAENAEHANCDVVTDSRYSGRKALKMTEGNAKVAFTFNSEKRQKYIVYVAGEGLGGEKQVSCRVNGTKGSFRLNTYAEVEVGTYIMQQGVNTIEITPDWTWFAIDYIRLASSEELTLPFDISTSPVDPEATTACRVMYTFLLDNFGKRTISGMMTGEMGSSSSNVKLHTDVKAVYTASGKYPALIGFDFMNGTSDNTWDKDYTRSAVNLAKDTWRRGGLPNFTWHWRDPSHRTNEFYTNKTEMRITDAMNEDGTWNTASALYKNIIKDIDIVADYFLELQRAGMACSFRPLHEASGGWFWWGREGAAPFKKLYHLIYKEMTEVKGVHNVIWIWNAGANDKDWNPGEEYYDVISADIYNADFDYSSNYPDFDKLRTLSGGRKIIALSENGPVPDIQKCEDEDAMWSWWMPWYNTWGGKFVSKTSQEEWKKVMSDPRVITLEDLSQGWVAYTSISAPLRQEPVRHMLFTLDGRLLQNLPDKGGIYIRNGEKRMRD